MSSNIKGELSKAVRAGDVEPHGFVLCMGWRSTGGF